MFAEYIRLLGDGTCVTPLFITITVLLSTTIIVITVLFAQTYIETGEHGAKKLNTWRKISLSRTF